MRIVEAVISSAAQKIGKQLAKMSRRQILIWR
jgi:hypothetical protein